MNFEVKIRKLGTASVDAKNPRDAAFKALIELAGHHIQDMPGPYECHVEQYDDAWVVSVNVAVQVGPEVPVAMGLEVVL